VKSRRAVLDRFDYFLKEITRLAKLRELLLGLGRSEGVSHRPVPSLCKPHNMRHSLDNFVVPTCWHDAGTASL
jgi:hypothetical protein